MNQKSQLMILEKILSAQADHFKSDKIKVIHKKTGTFDAEFPGKGTFLKSAGFLGNAAPKAERT